MTNRHGGNCCLSSAPFHATQPSPGADCNTIFVPRQYHTGNHDRRENSHRCVRGRDTTRKEGTLLLRKERAPRPGFTLGETRRSPAEEDRNSPEVQALLSEIRYPVARNPEKTHHLFLPHPFIIYTPQGEITGPDLQGTDHPCTGRHHKNQAHVSRLHPKM